MLTKNIFLKIKGPDTRLLAGGHPHGECFLAQVPARE